MDNKFDLDSMDDFSSQESNSSFSSCAYSQNDPSSQNSYFGSDTTNDLGYFDKSQFCSNNFSSIGSMDLVFNKQATSTASPINSSTYNPLFYSVDCNNNFYNPPNVQPFPPYSANGAESEHFPKIPPVTTAAAYETFSSYPGEFKSEFSSSLAQPTTDGSIESPANGGFPKSIDILAHSDVSNTANSMPGSCASQDGALSDKSSDSGEACSMPSVMTPSELDQKLMQKRERNRIAARKCRDKKLNKIKFYENRIQDLEKEIRSFEDDVVKLSARKNQLRAMLINICAARLTSNMNHHFDF